MWSLRRGRGRGSMSWRRSEVLSLDLPCTSSCSSQRCDSCLRCRCMPANDHRRRPHRQTSGRIAYDDSSILQAPRIQIILKAEASLAFVLLTTQRFSNNRDHHISIGILTSAKGAGGHPCRVGIPHCARTGVNHRAQTALLSCAAG